MRFLADENFPKTAVEELRRHGADVAWVRQSAPGILDREVLAWAEREKRVLLTFDKDFGELARSSAMAAFGVILFRVAMPRPPDAGRALAELILSRGDWRGRFSVVEPGRVRIRSTSADR
ncbi:MAG: DUF5615 family PIN-like protein [Beijerinckiaceae bacterium]